MSFIERFERILDRSVPWLVIALIPFIILSFFVDDSNRFYLMFSWFDTFVLVMVALDLVFKAFRASSMKGFLKSYWFAIISLMPVFLVLRLFGELALFADLITGAQDVGSEVTAIQRQSGRSTRVSHTRHVSRMRYFARFARPLARLPRLARAAEFFHHPDARGKAV
ncbi:MAG: hypothetical protein ACMXYM_02830 [Candidatus Woesearchaeota archaeon]